MKDIFLEVTFMKHTKGTKMRGQPVKPGYLHHKEIILLP